jgi:hypothetical protein
MVVTVQLHGLATSLPKKEPRWVNPRASPDISEKRKIPDKKTHATTKPQYAL